MEKTMQDKETKEKIKREIFATLWSETDKLHLEYVFELIEELEQKAREEGRDEGINAVLYPKLKRDKNGTLKREGWVDTSKLTRRTKMEKEEMSIYIWERVNMMSDNYHSEGGVVVVAKSLERAREIAREHFNPEEEHETLTDYDTTVFNTEPQKVFRVTSKEEYYCDFPDAGCC